MNAVAALSPVTLGFLGSLLAGLTTSVGAAPVLFGKTPSRKWRDISLGFAAGVMLAASFFSLIIPALDAAEAQGATGAMPALIVCAAILLGKGAVAMLNETVPHEHFRSGREGPEAAALRRVWLFIIAIAIHNAPEGWPWAWPSVRTGSRGASPSRSASGCRTRPRGSPSPWRSWASATPGARPSGSRHSLG